LSNILAKGSNVSDISNLIKKRRKILHITQEQLSDISNIGLRTIKGIETGKINPTLNTLNSILDCMGFEMFITLKSKVDEN
jgi:predicted transcriptional regulator